MMFIDKRIIVNGKKVAVLDSRGGELIADCINFALDIAKNGKFDEVRFCLNGVNLTATEQSTFEELREIFFEGLKEERDW